MTGKLRLQSLCVMELAVSSLLLSACSLWGGTLESIGIEVSLPSGQKAASLDETVKCTVDKSANSKLCIVHDGKPIVWLGKYKKPVVLKGYSLRSANDCPERDPYKWTLDGSTDGKNWTLLDKQENHIVFTSRLEDKHFDIVNENAYQFYRLSFAVPTSINLFQVAKIELEPLGAKPEPIVSLPSGQTEGSTGETVECTVDGSSSTKLCVAHGNAPIVWLGDYRHPVVVIGYSLMSANDCPERDPYKWTLEGSSDGDTWTELDRHEDRNLFSKRFEEKDFDISNNNAWRYYRITFDPPSSTECFQISKIRLAVK